MAQKAFFQTRARAIDHLGRGQIADCPTAVTELWKNSHDAYARRASLHIYEGSPPVAAVFDDGCGMTLEDILNRWLTIGTESKATSDLPKSDKFGLPDRPKMGEKGIGRLSAGFLAPVTILVTKKAKSSFTTALVDWRFFENPYLSITDIQIPCEEFDSLDELPGLIKKMVQLSLKNLVGGNASSKVDKDRVEKAWKNFSKQQKGEKILPTTETLIKKLNASELVTNERLLNWSVAREEVDHGTAIFLIDLNRELAVWVDKSVDADDIEGQEAIRSLKRTLTGFLTPSCVNERDFNYHFQVHNQSGSKIRLDSSDQISTDYLQSFEHYLDGKITADGWFVGKVKAFGNQQKSCKFNLNMPGVLDKRGRSRVGEFSIEVASVEQDPSNSSHDQSDLNAILKLQQEASGMMVYRDGVRVLPYGRPDSDFFGLEERRSKHAGREFWAHRKVFGRVYLTRSANPNLKDKAGREGLVENQSKRLMRSMVIAVLKETARRYYGTGSPIRDKELASIEARNSKGRESAKAARKIKRKDFLTKLRQSVKAVEIGEDAFEDLAKRCAKISKSKDGIQIATALEEIQELRSEVDELDLPHLPKGLEDREEQYRETRDRIADINNSVSELASKLAKNLAALKESDPAEIIESIRAKQVAKFEKQSKAVSRSLMVSLKEFEVLWRTRLLQGSEELDDATAGFVDEVREGESLTWAVEEIQAEVERFGVQLLDECRNAENAINMLVQGVDLTSALTVSDEGEMSANEKIQQLNLLAQSGIAVELISHELEHLSSETEYNLKRLPEPVRKSAAFKRASTAFSSLVSRFRFLAPLSVATYRSRREITGKEIADYVSDFFEHRLQSAEVSFQTTKAFDEIVFSDVPSRIFPVFINLVNNSLFWLKFTKKKPQIRFDFKKGVVIVADTGPGVDIDDVDNLFQMFFTKRPQGRGIGLYLCRANLAVARHEIRLASASDPKILSGANFVIKFRDVNG